MSFFCVIFVAKETEMEKNTKKVTESNALKNAETKKPQPKTKKTQNNKVIRQKKVSISVSIEMRKKALIEAMKKTLGNVTRSCEMVGINRKTFYEYCKDDETFKENIEEIGENALDFVESKLFQRIEGVEMIEEKAFSYEGEVKVQEIKKQYPPDTTAIIFYLKTKGKKRGYIETQEVVNKNAPIDPFEGKTEEEIDEMLREIEEEERKDAERIREFKKVEDPIDDETDDDRT